MVYLTRRLYQVIKKRRQHRFIDSIYIYIRGGTGGNGLPRYGGIGGKGGDVYLEASEGQTLNHIVSHQPNKRFIAGNGETSRSYRILGRPGNDCIIKTPVGITAIAQGGKLIGDLNVSGDKILVAKGGSGGTPDNQFAGQKGQALCVTLDLKLIADVGFVGFPNAGKSTLLKALSRASPKIANYPFTTICPNLGEMVYEDGRQISLADLPGLIEGAHVNFGMGHRFLKHVIRTKLLLFVVDVTGFQLSLKYPERDAFETIMLLNKELELYKEELTDKPAILAINKMDVEGANEKFAAVLEKLKLGKENKDGLPSEIQPTNLMKFNDIIPIMASKAHNIEKLKNRIRTLLDFYSNLEMGEKQKSLQVLNSAYIEESKSLRYV